MLRYYRRAYLYQDDTVSGYSRSYSCRCPVAMCDFDFARARGCLVDIILRSGHNHERKSRDFTLVNLRRPRESQHIELARNFTLPCAILLHHLISSEYLDTLVSNFFPLRKSIQRNYIFHVFSFFKIQIKIYINISISCIMSEESKRQNSKYYRHRIIKAEVPRRFETPDNITTANLNISRYRFYDLFAHTLISLVFYTHSTLFYAIKINDRRQLLSQNNSQPYARTFSNKTFTLSMRYINEEVHTRAAPTRTSFYVLMKRSLEVSGGKAKGARAGASPRYYDKTRLDSCSAMKSAGREKIVTISRRANAIRTLPIIITSCYYTPIRVPIRLRGYASIVITGITSDSYSCTQNFLCAPLMSMLILYQRRQYAYRLPVGNYLSSLYMIAPVLFSENFFDIPPSCHFSM